MPVTSIDRAMSAAADHIDTLDSAGAGLGTEGGRSRLTVRQRMEALGWRFALDEDTCTVELTRLVGGKSVAHSSYDVAYRQDLERCAAEAEAAGDLLHD